MDEPRSGLTTGSDWSLHEDHDGRATLQDLFHLYTKESGFSVRKVAAIIADNVAVKGRSKAENDKAQQLEDDRTKSALQRWINAAQSELFKEPEKRDRLCKRLAQLMSQVPLLNAIFEARAVAAERIAAGTSFGFFYYGPGAREAAHPSVQARLDQLQGLYEIEVPETFGDGAWDEPIMTTLWHRGRYVYFSRPPGANYLLTHMFKAPTGSVFVKKGKPQLTEITAGYAFPLPSGEVDLLLTDYSDPRVRRNFQWFPTELLAMGVLPRPNDLPKLPFVARSSVTLPTSSPFLADVPKFVSDAIVLSEVDDRKWCETLTNIIQEMFDLNNQEVVN